MTGEPLVQSYYRLARAFGWTPQQTQSLTMAQIGLFLEMLDTDGR